MKSRLHNRIQHPQQKQVALDPAKQEMMALNARLVQELGLISGSDKPVVKKQSRRRERLGTSHHIISAPPRDARQMPSQKKTRIVSSLQEPKTEMPRLKPSPSPGFHFTTTRASRSASKTKLPRIQPSPSPGFHFTTTQASRSASVHRPSERREKAIKVSRSRGKRNIPSVAYTRPVTAAVTTPSSTLTPVRQPTPKVPQRPRIKITDAEADATRLRLDEHRKQQQRDLNRLSQMTGLTHTKIRAPKPQRSESFSRNERLEFIRKHSLSREREDLPEKKAHERDVQTRPETGYEGLTNRYSSVNVTVRREKPKYLQSPSLPQSFDTSTRTRKL